MIDYYGLQDNHHFPLWHEAKKLTDVNQKIKLLEQGMKDSINESMNFRFIPYIQLHEFEALLFNDIEIFREQIPAKELTGIEELADTFKQFSNPEMINNNKETSPSHRLQRIIKGYDKIVYGNILAEAIGLEKIRNKCPRFNNWIGELKQLKKL